MALDPIRAKDIADRIEDSLWTLCKIRVRSYLDRAQLNMKPRPPELLRLLVEAQKALSDHAEGRKP